MNDATGTSEAAVGTTQGTMAMGMGAAAAMAAVIAAVAIRSRVATCGRVTSSESHARIYILRESHQKT